MRAQGLSPLLFIPLLALSAFACVAGAYVFFLMLFIMFLNLVLEGHDNILIIITGAIMIIFLGAVCLYNAYVLRIWLRRMQSRPYKILVGIVVIVSFLLALLQLFPYLQQNRSFFDSIVYMLASPVLQWEAFSLLLIVMGTCGSAFLHNEIHNQQ